MRVGEWDVEVRGGCAARDLSCEDVLTPEIIQDDAHRERARGGLQESRLDTHPVQVAPRREMHRRQRRATARLQIDRLPHAPRGTVPLLAFQFEGVWRVVHT